MLKSWDFKNPRWCHIEINGDTEPLCLARLSRYYRNHQKSSTESKSFCGRPEGPSFMASYVHEDTQEHWVGFSEKPKELGRNWNFFLVPQIAEHHPSQNLPRAALSILMWNDNLHLLCGQTHHIPTPNPATAHLILNNLCYRWVRERWTALRWTAIEHRGTISGPKKPRSEITRLQESCEVYWNYMFLLHIYTPEASSDGTLS